MAARRRVWIHRAATGACVLLAVPGVLWWKDSILFVILLSLATQAWTSYGAAEAADDSELRRELEQIRNLLEQRRSDGG
ncbi:hypothetical protein [Paractinoplanes toevensis]|uniref:Uncharacterized protein n=1 Tax=Paractinoplanes toevensis TaxID=571911 RepID=A0A919T575_9ACTN|nr:hypothetical protein [Actinoplanes toevensis]GIM88882.1 hypothetical protein Ato02nite_006750 [Actinoplanes toevensis]